MITNEDIVPETEVVVEEESSVGDLESPLPEEVIN